MKLREDLIVLGDATAGWLLWRVGGQLHMTVVVKATFALTADEEMARKQPLPIHREDVLLASGDGVVAPSDLAPYLGETDVTVCGRAEDADRMVRLVLRRDTHTLLDKRAPLSELGAVAAHDEARRGRLSAEVRKELAVDVPDLPVDMDWGYFHAAPPDQRVPFLRGGEWLLLRGLEGDELTRSQLPALSGAIRVWPRGGEIGDGYPVATALDRLLIDGAAQTATVTWRGAIPLDSEDVLRELRVAVAIVGTEEESRWDDAAKPPLAGAASSLSLTTAGQLALGTATTAAAPAPTTTAPTVALEMAEPRPHPTVFATPALGPGAESDDEVLEGTIAIARVVDEPSEGGEEELESTIGIAQAVDASSDDGLEGTIGIAQVVDPEAVTPFPLASPGVRPALSLVPIPGAPWATRPQGEDALEQTVGLTTAAPSATLPFAGTADAPPPAASEERDLRGATTDLSPAEAARVFAEAGLPFGGSDASSAPPNEPEPDSSWVAGPPSPQAPPKRGKALSLNAQIKAELGLEVAPPAAQAPPSEPARLAPPAETGEAAVKPVAVGAAPDVDPASAPAPPEGASHGEEFLAALEWLTENEQD